MLARQHIEQWARQGFLFIRVPAGAVRRLSFESIDHSKHLSTQTGFHAFFHRRDGKDFGVIFSNEVKRDCRHPAPTAIIPNADPELAWWIFPPAEPIDNERVIAFR
jgi:hypothetical protein